MLQSQQVLEWQAQARLQTRIKTMRRMLLRSLKMRYQAIPEDVTAAVESMTDVDELDRWFDAAVTAPSREVFRAAIKQPVSNGAK